MMLNSNHLRPLCHVVRFLLISLLVLCTVHSALAQRSLTIALSGNINTLDPHMSGSVATDLSVSSHLYSSLVLRDANLHLQPNAAVSWKMVDANTWEFQLHGGIHFSDGEPLDSSVVRWNIQRVQNPKTNARIRPWFSQISDVQVVSSTVFRIITSTPYPALLDQLTMFFLLPPKWASEHHPATAAMGTGPYDIADYVAGDHLTLVAKPNYWGAKPAFDRINFRIIIEPESRVSAVLAGEIDYARNIPIENIDRVNVSGHAHAAATGSARSIMIKFNDLKPPFKNNRNLRLALNYAVDKQTIRDTILSGAGDVLRCQVLTPAYFGYNPDLKPIPFDPAKAREYLKLSGVPKGSIIDLDMPVGVYFAADEITQAVAGQIEEVLGIGVRIHEMDFGVYMNKYIKAEAMAPMEYITQAWPTLDADGLLTLFAPGNVYAYWDDKEFGEYLKQGRSAVDPQIRLTAYRKATQRMCDEAPIIFLMTEPLSYAVSNKVRWTPRPDDWTRASDFTPVTK